MKKDWIKSCLVMLFLVLLVAGCSGGKKVKQDMNLLKTQVGGLTTEVNRVSEEGRLAQEFRKEDEERTKQLEQTVSDLQTKAGVARSGGVSTQAGLYRTPSGFELKSADLQSALRNAGYYNGPVDGKVGMGTIDAIRRFQSDNGLDADGVCGRKTWAKLKGYTEGMVK